ncbi:MAG: hypothetical protein FJ109_17365, partial [Deltaproteobacteria bacterium]|nr:hypothetical protein [Deltaproteobacteria bacterium]
MQSTSSSMWIALGLAGLVLACSPKSNDGRSDDPDSLSFIGGDSVEAMDTGAGVADGDGPDETGAETRPHRPDDTRGEAADQVPDATTEPTDVKDVAHADGAGSDTSAVDGDATGPDDSGLPQDAVTPPPEDAVEPTPDLPGSSCEYCGPDQVCTNGTCVPAWGGSCACVPGPEDCPDPPGGGQIPGAVTPDAFPAFVTAKGQSEHWGACTGGDELACHLFVRQVTRSLYEQDPNWGLLTKVPP